MWCGAVTLRCSAVRCGAVRCGVAGGCACSKSLQVHFACLVLKPDPLHCPSFFARRGCVLVSPLLCLALLLISVIYFHHDQGRSLLTASRWKAVLGLILLFLFWCVNLLFLNTSIEMGAPYSPDVPASSWHVGTMACPLRGCLAVCSREQKANEGGAQAAKAFSAGQHGKERGRFTEKKKYH